jgi:D-arginine dehydrogenase
VGDPLRVAKRAAQELTQTLCQTSAPRPNLGSVRDSLPRIGNVLQLSTMRAEAFIVTGAGIAGASAAYELAKAAPVIILERESQPGYHTTGRSAAVFSEIYGNATIRAVTIRSRDFFASPPNSFAEHPLWSPRPTLMVARTGQMGRLRVAYQEWARLVPSIQLLEGDSARRATPMLKPDYVAGAVIDAGACDLDVNEIHRGFLRGAAQAGAKLVCNAEVSALVRESAGWRVQTKAGEFTGGVVVNAGGAWGDEIGVLAGAHPVGLVPKRRTAVLFDPAPAVDVRDWPIIIDADEQFYFKPDAGKLLGSPADETASPPCDAQPEELDVAVAIDRIEQASNFRVQRVLRKWAGLRSFVADKSPVVGFDPEVPGFFWLVAQGGYGIQTAPGLGRIAAALACSAEIPEDLRQLGVAVNDLSPARMRNRRRTVA